MLKFLNPKRLGVKLFIVRLSLILFFMFAAFLPLLSVFVKLFDPSVRDVFQTPQFVNACVNSLVLALCATLISVSMAFLVAWVLCRTRIKGKGFFAALMTLPMLIPSLAHGMGLIYLFGSNGIVTNLINLNIEIYGYTGIIVGSVLYSFPSAFLLFYDVLKYEDSSAYEAADVLGIPKLSQFASITMPYLKKPLISVVFATFTLIVTDYGVPLIVGGKTITLPVLMYQEAVGLLNFNTGAAVGFILLIPAVIAFLVDMLTTNKVVTGYVRRPFTIKKSIGRDVFAYVFVAAVSIFVLLPVVSFVLVAFATKYPIDLAFTFENVYRSLDMNVEMYWANSILIGLVVSIIGVILTFSAAYLTTRMPGQFAKVMHLMCIITLAVPGIVLGLAYMVFFGGTPLYGTFLILILVNLVHFFASPYLLAYNSLGKLNKNLESVGLTLGVGRFRIFKDVIVPLERDTLFEMFSYFFVNCMVTISAVSFLAGTVNMPLALLVTDLDSQRLIECAAFVSLLILITNIVFKCLMQFIRTLAKKRMSC